MHRIHAIRLALLCSAVVVVLAACGGSQVQVNYGSLANEVCRELSAATKPKHTSEAKRIQALEAALSGLQNLNPPASVQKIYLNLVGNFKAAVDLLKPNMQTIERLARRLHKHPNDRAAQKQYDALVGSLNDHLSAAARDAHTLGIGNCEKAVTS